jgi:hypothetical protein
MADPIIDPSGNYSSSNSLANKAANSRLGFGGVPIGNVVGRQTGERKQVFTESAARKMPAAEWIDKGSDAWLNTHGGQGRIQGSRGIAASGGRPDSGWDSRSQQAFVGMTLRERGRERKRENEKEQERLSNRSSEQVEQDDRNEMEDFLSTQRAKRVFSPTGKEEQQKFDTETSERRNRDLVLRSLASSGNLGSGGY